MCRVTIGHLRVTIALVILFSISKHKANTTELHPKVRQTCLPIIIAKILALFKIKIHKFSLD